MVSYIDIDGLVSTTHNTVNRLFEYKNGGDALMLYFRYIQQRKQQQNNQTYSADIFMIKATGWGRDKFYKVKKILVDLKFIETIQKFDEHGKMAGSYVKVNFIIETSPSIDIDAVVKNRTPGNTESVKQDTNTLVSKVNTLIEKVNAGELEKKNRDMLEIHLKKFTSGSTRFCFFSSMIENINLFAFPIDEKCIEAIEKKLGEFRSHLGDEKSRLDLQSFWEYHRVEQTVMKSIVLRLNTWLKYSITKK